MKRAYRAVTGGGDKPTMTPGSNGYLEKLGGVGGRSWQKRYFELSGSSLVYSKKPGEDSSGEINLSGMKLYAPAKNKPTASPKLHTMELCDAENSKKGTNKTYYLAADSADELKAWIAAMEPYLSSESVIKGTSLSDRFNPFGGGDDKEGGGDGDDAGGGNGDGSGKSKDKKKDKKKEKSGEKPTFEGEGAPHLERIYDAVGEGFEVEIAEDQYIGVSNYDDAEKVQSLCLKTMLDYIADGVVSLANDEETGQYWKDAFLAATSKRKIRFQAIEWDSSDYSEANLLGFRTSYHHTIYDGGVLLILSNKSKGFSNASECRSNLAKGLSTYEEFGDQGHLDGFEWAGTPSMPSMGMPSLSMPSRPGMPGMPSMPSGPSMPKLGMPSMPSMDSPDMPDMPDRKEKAPEEEKKDDYPYPHPYTEGVPYLLRANIAEQLKRFHEHLDRIKACTGVDEWKVEIPFDQMFRQIASLKPDNHDNHGERLGSTILGTYMDYIADGIQALCKNEISKSAFLGATSQRTIYFFIQEAELDDYDWVECPRGARTSYAQTYFDMGGMFVALPIEKYGSNASECRSKLEESISVWEELGNRCDDPDISKLSTPGMPGMPGVPEMSLPPRPEPPGLPGRPSLPSPSMPSRPKLSMPSAPAMPDMSLPSWDECPSLDAPMKEVCSEACHASMADPKITPLMLRLNIEDGFQRRADHIRRINEASGEEFHVEVTMQQFKDLIPPEEHDQTYLRLGTTVFGTYLDYVADAVVRECKSECFKEHFLKATSERKIVFEKVPEEYLQEQQEAFRCSTYSAARFEDGVLYIMIAKFSNASECSQKWKEAISNWEESQDAGCVTLMLKDNMEDNQKRMDDHLERLGGNVGTDCSIDVDWEAWKEAIGPDDKIQKWERLFGTFCSYVDYIADASKAVDLSSALSSGVIKFLPETEVEGYCDVRLSGGEIHVLIPPEKVGSNVSEVSSELKKACK